MRSGKNAEAWFDRRSADGRDEESILEWQLLSMRHLSALRSPSLLMILTGAETILSGLTLQSSTNLSSFPHQSRPRAPMPACLPHPSHEQGHRPYSRSSISHNLLPPASVTTTLSPHHNFSLITSRTSFSPSTAKATIFASRSLLPVSTSLVTVPPSRATARAT
jgi:hypothetical protein